MSSWIESHTVLIRHRKVVSLARELRLKPVYVVGHLHVLWHTALEQQEDGDLSSWTDEFIAASACYPGDAPQFVSLLKKHRWLDDGNLLHDWTDYAGRYLESRYRTSNPEKLVTIWKKHGRNYLAEDGRRRKPDSSQTKDRPKSVHPPNQTNPPTNKRRSATDDFKERMAVNATNGSH